MNIFENVFVCVDDFLFLSHQNEFEHTPSAFLVASSYSLTTGLLVINSIAVMISVAAFHEACANNAVEEVEQTIDANPRIAYQSEAVSGKVGLHIAY